MLPFIDPINVLLLDIECVSSHHKVEEMSEAMQKCWADKAGQLSRREGGEEMTPEEMYPQKAAIYCEFGKIVCISVGIFRREGGALNLRIKSFFGHDEKQILLDFTALVNQYFGDPNRHYLCGHNIKEFDIPYICRRMIVNGLELPPMLNLSGKKPWETKHLLDTMEMWSFGDRKAYTSLKLLCAVFGIPTPKDDIDGSDVGRVYWEENDVERIEKYCKKDVAATAQVFLRLRLQPLLEEEQIKIV